MRVHKDEMGAQAFTLVQDVVFGTEYALNLRNTLLRIRGAIQVLIAKEGGQQPGGSMGEVHEPEEGIESG